MIGRTQRREVLRGERFEFGRNWQRFLNILNEDHIAEAVRSLKRMLEIEDLNEKSFLDVGSGSGLFSLAARRLGARVYSFDYDPQSVTCAVSLRDHFFPGDTKWTVEEGSVLDDEYVKSLGQFDIVYSWGVLHHTGDLWHALDNATLSVGQGGRLWIAVYNDQGWHSHMWARVKRLYCSSLLGKIVVIAVYFPYFFGDGLLKDMLLRKNPVSRYTNYKRERGMSRLTDWLDWLGGYPFEVAKPEEIFYFLKNRGFQLERLKTCGGGLGNNEFVLVRSD